MPSNLCKSTKPKYVLLAIVVVLMLTLVIYLAWFEIYGIKKDHSEEQLRMHSKMYLRTMVLIVAFVVGYVSGYGAFSSKSMARD